MINAFIIALTIYSAPVQVADASGNMSSATLQVEQTIMFSNTTAKNTLADCVRVAKALTTSKKVAFCDAAAVANPDFVQ